MQEPDQRPDSNRPDALVEHFFRHEYANLVASLTRGFGVARIDLVEDMVGAAILDAMHHWKQSGVPENPPGWIYRVARNKILDHLRREATHAKAIQLSLAGAATSMSSEQLVDQLLDPDDIPDNLLRMMFVCCHPDLDRPSQIGLTLKILCGFSIAEIARALLIRPETAKKRIQRAKNKLAAAEISMAFPPPEELQERLSVVHDVLYLMFNEGYSTTDGTEAVDDDVCEEAARLCHLLCEHGTLASYDSYALLALMLFHAARLDARIDDLGEIVLLDQQDRSRWDHRLIGVAQKWLARSANERPSRFHFEAMIANLHCSAPNIDQTNWSRIVRVYSHLLENWPSPLYQLNRAIALGEAGQTQTALEELRSLQSSQSMRDYYLLDCATARLHHRNGDQQQAIDAYLTALSRNVPQHQRNLIESQLRQLTSEEQM